MSQRTSERGGWLGVVIGLAVFALCVALSGGVVFLADDIAGVISNGPPTGWHTGTPKADLAVLAPSPDSAPTPDPAKLQAILAPLLVDPALGPAVNAQVFDISTGQPLAGHNGDAATIPASTIKLVTAAAVLSTLGPTYQFTTRAVAGAGAGEVVLIGAGDPTLIVGPTGVFPADSAKLTDLVEQVKRSLGGTPPTRVTFDASVFAAPPTGPWDADIPGNGVVSQIVGLMTNGGRVDTSKYAGSTPRVAEPDVQAAKAFATLLGVPAANVTRGTAPPDARELGAVRSLPLARQVEIMLTESDNVIAESLARQVAIKRGKPATFEGAAAAEAEAIGALGLPVGDLHQFDGSGLARTDKLPPSLLAKIVALAAKPDHPELRPILSGMPVSGYSGTLAARFRKPPLNALGMVRAKTGTLRSVSSIAGLVVTADGRQLAFAVLADNVPVGGNGPAQDALDRIVSALATCGCR
jgi:D-alanyl-D-alanine carboxypeptidase/D-alanyl-D-alanine-endopeptidase (penicillin-binding protein 4)